MKSKSKMPPDVTDRICEALKELYDSHNAPLLSGWLCENPHWCQKAQCAAKVLGICGSFATEK
jgi:hypothetical protein